jgi:parallel beta-helix repeat protein
VVASDQNGFSLAQTLGGAAIQTTAVGATASLAFNGPSVTVTRNTISANKQAGIYAAGTAWAAITGNTIESNQNGVNAQGTSKLTIGGAFGDLNPGLTTANFIRKNTLFGVNVLNTAFAQIGFNSMSGNKRGGISSSPTAPTIRSVTYNGANLVVTLGGAITANQVIHLYTAGAGTSQGLTYLGRFTSAEVGAGNTLTVVGLPGIRVGTKITATVSDNSGAAPTTSAFARLVTAKRAR